MRELGPDLASGRLCPWRRAMPIEIVNGAGGEIKPQARDDPSPGEARSLTWHGATLESFSLDAVCS
jgi:hypothetical protein